MALVNGSVWSAYSYYVEDPFIGICNYVGVAFAVTQVAVFIAYLPGGPLGISDRYTPLSEEGGALKTKSPDKDIVAV